MGNEATLMENWRVTRHIESDGECGKGVRLHVVMAVPHEDQHVILLSIERVVSDSY